MNTADYDVYRAVATDLGVTLVEAQGIGASLAAQAPRDQQLAALAAARARTLPAARLEPSSGAAA